MNPSRARATELVSDSLSDGTIEHTRSQQPDDHIDNDDYPPTHIDTQP